ncbi:MAG: 30S ribosomal protein S20 [Bacteroidia bacterium]|nr:30S ribosomal protein S20 [Bacteroidia bacterium]
MANHKSALKRIRQTEERRMHNKYYAKTVRNAIKDLRLTKDKGTAGTLLPKVSAMLDKLAKINVIHKNKASNLKSSLSKHVNDLVS